MTREGAIGNLIHAIRWNDIPSKEALEMAIKALEQEPKTGHWEHGRELSRVFISGVLKGINYEDWHCSNCHCVVEQSIKPKWSYCPNCGAKMIEPQERNGEE